MRYILPCLLSLSTAAAAADEPTLIYTQPMEGVYAQNWLIADPVYYAAGIRTVTVIGEGKAGDFKGELYIDCPMPAQSKWLSVADLFLTASSVPVEAIIGIRSVLCDGT